jgi:hypothetical protein
MLRASHGSPHARTKFDFSKIGTGEGAQAYGHGLYFGQGFDSPVAQEYAKNVVSGPQNVARRGGLEGLKLVYPNRPDQWYQDMLSQADDLGHLYNVELKWPDAAREAADPLGEHHLLDWDAPFANQSESIQELLKQSYKSVYGNRSEIRQRLKEKFAAQGKESPLRAEMSPITGEQIYNNLASQFGSRDAASKQLAELGIPGIRYLDQGSRGAGEGTRNYVMFDDRFPNIVSRNGVSLADLLRK